MLLGTAGMFRTLTSVFVKCFSKSALRFCVVYYAMCSFWKSSHTCLWLAEVSVIVCMSVNCRYLAPEIIQEKPYGASVDWWALGVLLYEMMMGDSPFEADDDDELFHIICHSKPDVRSLPQTARDVVNGFLTKSPSKRYGGMWAMHCV